MAYLLDENCLVSIINRIDNPIGNNIHFPKTLVFAFQWFAGFSGGSGQLSPDSVENSFLLLHIDALKVLAQRVVVNKFICQDVFSALAR